MKKIIILTILTLFTISLLTIESFAKSTRAKGYTKKSGKYVAPHYKTTPNKTKTDNYSTKGNVNPYTGKEGTKDPYKYPSDGGN